LHLPFTSFKQPTAGDYRAFLYLAQYLTHNKFSVVCGSMNKHICVAVVLISKKLLAYSDYCGCTCFLGICDHRNQMLGRWTIQGSQLTFIDYLECIRLGFFCLFVFVFVFCFWRGRKEVELLSQLFEQHTGIINVCLRTEPVHAIQAWHLYTPAESNDFIEIKVCMTGHVLYLLCSTALHIYFISGLGQIEWGLDYKLLLLITSLSLSCLMSCFICITFVISR